MPLVCGLRRKKVEGMSDPVQDFCVANEFVDCVSDLELLFGSELAVEAEDVSLVSIQFERF